MNLKMDFLGPLGTYLGSFVSDRERIKYFLAKEKTFYVAKAGGPSLRSLLAVDLKVQDLVSVLFQQPLPADSWRCITAEARVSCSNDVGLQLQMYETLEKNRIIEFRDQAATVTVSLRASPTMVEITDKTFDLVPPTGFRVIQK